MDGDTDARTRFARTLRDATGGRRTGFVAAYFVALSLLVFAPLLPEGYVLTLDMVFGPNTDYVSFGLRHKGPLYYSRLPFLLALDGLAVVVEDWVLQKAILLSVIPLAGLGTYATCRVRSTPARLFAGTLYAVNPFVYVRFLAGHWYILLGYALLPVAVRATYDYVVGESDGRRGLLAAVAAATLMGIPDPHVTGLFAVAVVVVSIPGTHRTNARRRLRRLLRFGGVFAAVNAYWLVPMLATVVGGGSQLSSFTDADLAVFSATGTIRGNLPLSVGMLYGFWRGDALAATDVLPFSLVVCLFAALLLLAVYGAVSSPDSFVRGVAAVGVLGFVLALGVGTSPTRLLWQFLFEYVPFAGAMRDTQKFSALLVFAYAVLGGAGVERLWTNLGSSGTRPTVPGRPDRRRLLALCLLVFVVSGPLVYALPAFGGFWGQVESTSYPEDWSRANDHIVTASAESATAAAKPVSADPVEGRVLFFPWHQYIRFSWTERTVATPAELFFERPVVRGRNLEIGGIETQVGDPTHRRVDALLADRENLTTFGADVAPLGVEYVVLSKEADYRNYAFLDDQSDLSVVFETDEIALYRNDAYDADAAPWPPAGPTVPWRALLVGTVVSVLAVSVGVRTGLTDG